MQSDVSEDTMWAKVGMAAIVAVLLAGNANLGYAQTAGDVVGGSGTVHKGNGPAIGDGLGPSDTLPGNGSSASGTGSTTNATNPEARGPDVSATGARAGAPGAAGSVPGVTGTGSIPGQTTTK